MKHPREVKISRGAIHLTTLISVALLLLIIGAVAILAIATHNETRKLKENVQLTAILNDSITDRQAAELKQKIKRYPFINTISLTTKQQALLQWNQATGEDLQQLFGANPLSPEIDFTLKADYTSPRQIEKISTNLQHLPGIQAVAKPETSFVDAMNANIKKIMYALAVIAALLITISFVLINNTVHLTIYSRRFTIHTMQLVGATNSFIRKPILIQNLSIGAIAGVIASAILAAALASSNSILLTNLAQLIPWPTAATTFAALIIAGALICLLAAYISSTKYLKKQYDELFQ